MTVRILIGDARERLRELPDASVNCCVTSPPYFGLRDYGVSGQIGLEATPDAFVAELVSVFREVRRVLRDDGTLWLNLGDSYAGSGRGGNPDAGTKQGTNKGSQTIGVLYGRDDVGREAERTRIKAMNSAILASGAKPKDLLGIPWLVAFALRADGWYLRQDIIWSKPNPMPESVTDRCTKAHEYLFLLSKSGRYYFDADAIAEPASYDPDKTKFPDGWDTGPGGHGSFHRNGREKGKPSSVSRAKDEASGARNPNSRPHSLSEFEAKNGRYYATRNRRSVWNVATQPFSEAHFATFPPALIEPCILAGCPKSGTVLDPFFGAGTTGLVADRNGRDCIGIELNPEYAAMAGHRISNESPMFAQVTLNAPKPEAA